MDLARCSERAGADGAAEDHRDDEKAKEGDGAVTVVVACSLDLTNSFPNTAPAF
ncbi:putative ubiquitin domain-containing protein DSK2a-like isoform [Sesbania bispinosa]|nr:putative ubiquitin domain-containing protein DSK2a-like isoform [Sesbania bispinosa]